MAKKRKKRNSPTQVTEKKRVSKTALLLLLALLGATLLATVIYRYCMTGPYFRAVLIAYMALGTASSLGYVIYNRGFVRRGVTVDMLPNDWSHEKKEEYIADGVRRMKQSRWLLIVAFALFATLAFDMIELYALPVFRGVLGFGQ